MTEKTGTPFILAAAVVSTLTVAGTVSVFVELCEAYGAATVYAGAVLLGVGWTITVTTIIADARTRSKERGDK